MGEYQFRNFEQQLRIKGFSRKTIDSYLYYNKDFLKLARKSPRDIKEKDIRNYLDYLALEVNSSASTMNVAYSALKNYYGHVYKRKFFINLPRAKKQKRLPVVLAKKEIKKMIKQTQNPKHNCILSLIYGCGLRISEVVKIKMNDIDCERKVLLIKKSKGNKDRYVPLPESQSEILIKQKRIKSGEQHLFTGRNNTKISLMSINKIVKLAASRAGITKDISPHTLRHSYATHLLESGSDIRYIQALLGHSRLETTQIYTKVAKNKVLSIISPLDA